MRKDVNYDDPWHWKNSQSALRQIVGSMVPEINLVKQIQPQIPSSCIAFK